MRTHSVNSNALAFKLFRNKKTLNLLTSVVQIHFININNSLYRAKNPENILSFQRHNNLRRTIRLYRSRQDWQGKHKNRSEITSHRNPTAVGSLLYVRPPHRRATSMGKTNLHKVKSLQRMRKPIKK